MGCEKGVKTILFKLDGRNNILQFHHNLLFYTVK